MLDFDPKVEDTLLQQFFLSSWSVWLQFYQGLINCIILLKKFLFLTMFAMETRKDTLSVIIATIARIKKCFINNKDHLDLNNHWKSWVDWISARQEKMLQYQKCPFQEKEPKSWKHNISTFLDNLSKENPLELQGYLNPFWKPEISVMYVSVFCYFFWHKLIIWKFENQWFLNFNCVPLIIKLAQVLEILFSGLWEIPLPIQLTFFRETFITTSWNKLIFLHGDMKCVLETISLAQKLTT